MTRRMLLTVAILLFACNVGFADELEYKDDLVNRLVRGSAAIIRSFDADTHRFGSGIWTCRDQQPMYSLAVAYATEAYGNPYYHEPCLLRMIVKSADPLIENMDSNGQWEFTKKDGSTWGKIWMPWTYSRWVRTFALIKDDMEPADRKRWAAALALGYSGISRSQLQNVHNISAHHAMGLYIAGKVLGRPVWCLQASEFMMKVVEEQSEAGYWSEGDGPVVNYNFVYVDALGTYYAVSGDQRVLPALERAAKFHRHFTYPDGRAVETIDQRNPYRDTIEPGNVGFTFTPVGRAFLEAQWSLLGTHRLNTDIVASLLLYGEEGDFDASVAAEEPFDNAPGIFVLAEHENDLAATIREGSWFICLSAYTTPISTSRWIQDRQSFISIYHEKVGLLLGGGNTKLQPGWSNFTIGDTTLLAHKPGDTSPNFRPEGELYHVPSEASISIDPSIGVELTYGAETCTVQIEIIDDTRIAYHIETTENSSLPVAAHLTILPGIAAELETGTGAHIKLADHPVAITPEQLGNSLTYGSLRFELPDSASVHWPVLPHNPYRKDGAAAPGEGRIEIRIPLEEKRNHTVIIEIE